ncbi:hypothetical protein HBH56_116710 [Parastagonospora nodorum]|nr:hypothetical protein HBH56_116710 [Parastagonospora nodorum]KAH3928736.1 hypothetical protein HBH54_132480 [Parastagonospora nodorum]KAH3973992.1 hypothetical protein HBH52_139030 [Parastagonospora nodorum]KAH4136550.1 hypothetical protein HBH45_132470 [Parastagonospora nodorum]KAH4160691.1 hypothetical protein HBH44_099830 [Parastagonospora nodorum]
MSDSGLQMITKMQAILYTIERLKLQKEIRTIEGSGDNGLLELLPEMTGSVKLRNPGERHLCFANVL